MFILFVCFVSMNLVMIRTEDIIMINIKANRQGICEVLPEVTLHLNEFFTLQIQSDYFIEESFWTHNGITQQLQDLKNSKFGISYERIQSPDEKKFAFVYTYSHTEKADHKSGGKWIFLFQLIRNYDPWAYSWMDWWFMDQAMKKNTSCSTLVQIVHSEVQNYRSSTTIESPGTARNNAGDISWLIPLVAIFGILLLLQSSFMVFERVKHLLSPTSPKANRGGKTWGSIADRPRLSLPPDEIEKEGPVVPNQSYRKKALDNTDEELRSPDLPKRHQGPLVAKQSYKNKVLDISEEERKTPGFVRRDLKAKLAQLPPNPAASKPFKLLKPVTPSPLPPPPPEKPPAFHALHRTAPTPPLHPKDLKVFPPPCRPRSIVNPVPRLSDVDWQYEELQPTYKYLNNYTGTPCNK